MTLLSAVGITNNRVTSTDMSPKVASATVFVPRQKQAQMRAWNALEAEAGALDVS